MQSELHKLVDEGCLSLRKSHGVQDSSQHCLRYPLSCLTMTSGLVEYVARDSIGAGTALLFGLELLSPSV